MSMIETPMPYRYYELVLAIVNGLVDSAFTACRYAQQPDESTEAYYDRRSLTQAIIHGTYSTQLVEAISTIVTAPENPTDLQFEQGVTKADWDPEYNDPYENAMDKVIEILHHISKDLAVAAYELNINEIDNYFKSLPQSKAEEN